MATFREVVARAWEFRPDWYEYVLLVLAAGAAWWWLDVPWWASAVACLIAIPLLSGLFAWLELENEAAALAEAEEDLRDLEGGDT